MTSPDRPELPYRGAWLLLGAEGIHIMEVPNPDPVHGRPGHGGFDRHACLNCKNVEGLRQTLEKAGEHIVVANWDFRLTLNFLMCLQLYIYTI